MTLVGYCVGGVLSAIYVALIPKGPVKNLVCFTTPIDFSKMELFQAMADQRHFDVDRLVDTLGIVPADVVVGGFEAQRPAGRIAGAGAPVGQPVERPVRQGLPHDGPLRQRDAAAAGRVLPPDGQGTAARQRACTRARLRIGGRIVDLSRITVPLLHVIAQYDHLVPPECAQPLVAQSARATRKKSCCRAATSASWPGRTRSSACGRSSIHGCRGDRHERARPATYPRTSPAAMPQVEIARMTPADRAALVGFVADAADARPAVRAARPEPSEGGRRLDALARGRRAWRAWSRAHGAAMVGCTAIVVDELSWSRHVGELRVLVAPALARPRPRPPADPGVLRAGARPRPEEARRADDRRPALGDRGVRGARLSRRGGARAGTSPIATASCTTSSSSATTSTRCTSPDAGLRPVRRARRVMPEAV